MFGVAYPRHRFESRGSKVLLFVNEVNKCSNYSLNLIYNAKNNELATRSLQCDRTNPREAIIDVRDSSAYNSACQGKCWNWQTGVT